MLHRLCLDDAGQDLVEYALLVSIIALVGIASLRYMGIRVMKMFYLADQGLHQ
jgi:Flp pilus assembly pilin Flp